LVQTELRELGRGRRTFPSRSTSPCNFGAVFPDSVFEEYLEEEPLAPRRKELDRVIVVC